MPLRFSILAAVLLTGCVGAGPASPERDAWTEARARWDAQRPDHYTFTLGLSCECVGPTLFYVSVDGNQVDSVAALDWNTGRVLPTGTDTDEGPIPPYTDSMTIDDLFDLIRGGLRARNEVRAEYDDALGYPTYAQPDVEAAAVDGSIGYSVQDFAAR